MPERLDVSTLMLAMACRSLQAIMASSRLAIVWYSYSPASQGQRNPFFREKGYYRK